MPGFNPFRNRFPYTNINDINLDWIIKRVKALSDAVASIDVSRMDEIAQQAETAQQDAATALEAAQNAETTANSVQGIANNALTTAQSAETTAQSAETTANSVQGIANNALSTAQSAETTANSVQGIANNALTTAQSAETTAQSAETTANSVQGIANNALTTAQSAETTAQSADSTASQAATAAGYAYTEAQAASAAASQATAAANQANANIAIVQDTDIASQNIAEGQYVVWRGALYTASSAIASGATLSSANLTAVSDGGLNDLKSTINFSNSITWISGFYGTGRKNNKVCYISFSGSIQLSGNSWTNIATISGLQISSNINFSVMDMYSNSCIGRLKTDGNLQLYHASGVNLITIYALITFIED